jgi:molybdenum cofactor cytidylyltransferase
MKGKNVPSIGAVILAAGASSRMGRPKLLLPWRGTSVIGHIIDQWRELGVAQIVVVRRQDDSALTDELNRLDFPKADWIENPRPERGMFSSIVCAAHWGGWREEVVGCAIVLGDQPHLRLQTLRALLAFQGGHPQAVCQPALRGHGRHPVLLPRRVFESLKSTRAETLKDFLKLMAVPPVQLSVDDAGLSLDMDTPEDYKEAVTRFGA